MKVYIAITLGTILTLAVWGMIRELIREWKANRPAAIVAIIGWISVVSFLVYAAKR